MMKILSVLSLLALSLISNLFAEDDYYEKGVILLKVWQPDLVSLVGNQVINGSEQFQSVLTQYSAITSRKLPHSTAITDGWYRVEFPTELLLTDIRLALLDCPDIRYATLNYIGRLSGNPNDALWALQWALQRIRIADAWNINTGNGSILIGVLDTGIDIGHEDLSPDVWINPGEVPGNSLDDDANHYCDDIDGWNFFPETANCPQPPPPLPELWPGDQIVFEGWALRRSYHGTRVAGVIAAKTYNGTGIAGVAGGWNGQNGARLVGLRVADPNFGDWRQDRAAAAINYLTALRLRGYKVIANMSFQDDIHNDLQLQAFKDAVEGARASGVVMVAAAGNCPKEPCLGSVDELPAPARWVGVLAIGASMDAPAIGQERRSPYSLWDGGKVLCVAPVRQAAR